MIVLERESWNGERFEMHVGVSLADLDPFQEMGIPCWLSPMLLDNPNEPELPFTENE